MAPRPTARTSAADRRLARQTMVARARRLGARIEAGAAVPKEHWPVFGVRIPPDVAAALDANLQRLGLDKTEWARELVAKAVIRLKARQR